MFFPTPKLLQYPCISLTESYPLTTFKYSQQQKVYKYCQCYQPKVEENLMLMIRHLNEAKAVFKGHDLAALSR